jgi:hypothetical protein
MRLSSARAVLPLLAIGVFASCASPLGKQYEYEEQIYLLADGRATVVIDASIPALVALRKLPLDPTLRSSVDRDLVRRLYADAGCEDVRVGQPWIRRGRRFVQIRVATSDINQLHRCGPLSWSTYRLAREEDAVTYDQLVGPPEAGDVGTVNWDGTELVAFKLHLPSRILFHNVKRLEDGANGKTERGNILTWEQRLSDRRAGQAIEMSVQMHAQSILHRTLWLFGGAFAAALLMLSTLVWWTMRRARMRQRPAGI